MLAEIHSGSEWNQSLRTATSGGRTAVVDFCATRCAPCKVISPVFDRLAEEHPQATFLRVDGQQPIAAEY